MTGRRERLRAEMLDTIRAVGLDELRRVGAADLSLREVADRAGISPAGLYRYVDGRDGLLELLITDGFDALAASLAAAVAGAGDDPRSRVLAFSAAYRDWARAEPAWFALILGSPLVGFAASDSGPTQPAARRFGAVMLGVFVDALVSGAVPWPPGDPLVPLADAFGLDADLPRDLLARVLRGWASLHGLVVLELDDHLDWSGLDVAELVAAEALALADDVGLPS